MPTRLWAKGAFQTARRVTVCFLEEGIFHLSFGGEIQFSKKTKRKVRNKGHLRPRAEQVHGYESAGLDAAFGELQGVFVGWHGWEMGGAEYSQEGGAKVRRRL